MYNLASAPNQEQPRRFTSSTGRDKTLRAEQLFGTRFRSITVFPAGVSQTRQHLSVDDSFCRGLKEAEAGVIIAIVTKNKDEPARSRCNRALPSSFN